MAEADFYQHFQASDWAVDILDHAPERIHLLSKDSLILYSNRHDTPAGDDPPATGKSIFDFILPKYREVASGVITAALANGVSGNFEAMLSFGTRARWFQTHVIPLKNTAAGADGERYPALALFHHDNPPTWAALAAVQRRTEALEQQLAERDQVLHDYNRYLDASGKLNIRLTRLNDVSVVLHTLAEQVKAAMNSGFSAIYQIENDWIEFSAGVRSPVLLHRKDCIDEGGLLNQALRENNILFYPQLDEKTAQHLWRTLPQDFNIHSLLIIPIVCADAFHGILYLGYDELIHFDNNIDLMLRAFIEATIDTLHRIHVVQKLERNISARKRELSVLYDLSTYSSEPVGLDDLLYKSLHRIMRPIKCETGMIFRAKDNSKHDDMVACWPQTGIPEPIKLFLRKGEFPVRPEPHESYHLAYLPPNNEYACMTVFINNKRKTGAYLRIFGSPKTLHDSEVIHLIISSARQLGLSIDSVLDRKLAEDAIILEERQRVARNLHDSITQSLYALTLSSDVALKAFNRKDDERFRSVMEDIAGSSLQALKEMRLMLYELRPAALEKTGLIEALELRLNTVERRTGMEATLNCTGKLQISDALEAELYHIISEALNNSLRHSGARAVHVMIRAATDFLSIEVEDNGKGFDVPSSSSGGMGLASMIERSRALGGNLSITSAEGQGTRVSLKTRVKERANG